MTFSPEFSPNFHNGEEKWNEKAKSEHPVPPLKEEFLPTESFPSITVLCFVFKLVIAVRDLAHLAEAGVRGVEGVAELEDFNLRRWHS